MKNCFTLTKIFVAALAMLSANASAAVTLLNYWKLDETVTGTNVIAIDSVAGKNITAGHGQNTMSSSTSIVAPGSTTSLHFSGGSGKYGGGTYPALPPDNYIVEVWVNPDRLTDQAFLTASKFNDLPNPTAGGPRMQINGGKWSIGVSGGTSSYVGQTNIAATVGEWVHLAFVRDGGINKAYINGELVSLLNPTDTAKAAVATTVSLPKELLLGCGDSGGASFSGYMDEVRYSSFDSGTFTKNYLQINQIPEPSTCALAGVGLCMAFALRRRRKN